MVKKLKTGVAYHGNRILKHVEEDMKDISARNMNTVPQKEEGFIDAKFIHVDRVVDLARYDDEKEIIKVALQEIKKRLKKN